MSDSNSTYRLSDLSARFQLELRGEGDLLIEGVGTLAEAGPDQVAFLANPIYRKELPGTRAGAVILKAELAGQCATNCLLAEDPCLAYARLATLFDPRPALPAGIHPSAVIAPSARLGKDVSIGPLVVVGEDCEIGDGSAIGPGTVIEGSCALGEGGHRRRRLRHRLRRRSLGEGAPARDRRHRR
jgi:UDP-3-O-[3-hydroxymyristoyl] glucosamine N-acyltransferase